MSTIMNTLREYRYLLLALVGSAALQISTIGRYSFWFDESYTSALVKYAPADSVSLTAVDVHPPLYYLVLKTWSALFGSSDVALRSLSTLGMLVSLTLVFFLVRKLVNAYAAGFAVLIAAIGPFVVRYGQEARMYGLGSVLILGSTLALVYQMQRPIKRRSTRLWVLYAVLVAGIVYTHYFGGIIVLVHAVYMLLNSHGMSTLERVRAVDRRWLLALGGAFALYLPWVPTLLSQLSAVNTGFWIPPVDGVSVVDTVSQLSAFYPLDRGSELAAIAAGAVGLLALATASIYVLRRRWLDASAFSLTIGAVGLVSLVLIVLSVLPMTTSYYYLRYFAQFSVLYYAGFGLLLYVAWRHLRWFVALGISAVVVGLQMFGVVRILDGVDKRGNQTHRAYDAIEQQYEQGDVLFTDGYFAYYDLHHYNQTDAPVLLASPSESFGSLEPIFRLDPPVTLDPEDVQSSSGRLWYLASVYDNDPPRGVAWLLAAEPQVFGDRVLYRFSVPK